MQFDDLAKFFDTGEFAAAVTLNLWDGDVDIEALFFASETEISQLEQLNTDPVPFLLAKSVDVAELKHENRVTIAGAEYYVLAIEPDGTGFSKITLEQRAD